MHASTGACLWGPQDKPKFGGPGTAHGCVGRAGRLLIAPLLPSPPGGPLRAPPRAAGIKKQACIARKCVNMQTREDDGGADETASAPAAARKRVKSPGIPAAMGFTTGDELDRPLDAMNKVVALVDDLANPEVVDMDMDDAVDVERVATAGDAKDGPWLGNSDALLDYLVRRKGRTEGWKRLREMEVEEARSQEPGSDWPWASKSALEVRVSAARPEPSRRRLLTTPSSPPPRAARALHLTPPPGGVYQHERPPPSRVWAKLASARALVPRGAGCAECPHETMTTKRTRRRAALAHTQ